MLSAVGCRPYLEVRPTASVVHLLHLRAVLPPACARVLPVCTHVACCALDLRPCCWLLAAGAELRLEECRDTATRDDAVPDLAWGDAW